MRLFVFVCAGVLLLGAAPAHGQSAPPPPTPAQPLILEPIHDTFVIAPEYKVTSLDNEVGQLAGVYAGRVLDQALFVGGAAYWLANQTRDFKLTYGGAVVGWSMPAGSHIRFGARGLAGFGTATLGTDITTLVRGNDLRSLTRFGGRGTTVPSQPGTIRVLARDDFAVFEPQANVLAHITDHVAVDVSAGYRFTAYDDVLRDRLEGATGSLALQLGW